MFFTKDFFSVIRVLFWPLALLYGLIVWLRNRLYDVGFFSSVGFSVPVISVGNLSTGGTGKTPHVEYLVRLLQYEWQVATLSRGYKRMTQGFLMAGPDSNAVRLGDEPMQYHLKFPELVVAVGEERMTAIPRLMQQRPDVDLVVLDDAFQHRSVRPGLSILITDYERPYTRDYVLPLGNLREGRRAADRADIIIVSKCPTRLTEAEADHMKRSISPKPYQSVYFSTIAYRGMYELLSGAPSNVTGGRALLVCGIAKPAPLVAWLEQQGMEVHLLAYPDHHYFNERDLNEILSAYQAWQGGPVTLVTTEKDAARLLLYRELLESWKIPIVVVEIAVAFLFDEGPLFDRQVVAYVYEELSENLGVYSPEEQGAETPMQQKP